MIPSYKEKQAFQDVVWHYYHDFSREMPWRETIDPYYVLVSELMLQQTQVERVIPKFNAFIATFPTSKALSNASLSDVLILWNGLGYNRRAKFLHEAAKKIETTFNGTIPNNKEDLVQLPGVGPNTAGAILAYGFNQPVSFIETNIRTVYFHHFFSGEDKVTDTQLENVVRQTIDQEHPREWYWALMDYGTYLKKQGVGRNSISAHYKKQSALKGSPREIRGQIIKALARHEMRKTELVREVTYDERFDKALNDLIKEGLITKQKDVFHLTK
jgi:A/G-specific adenine glycosylase